MGAGGIKIKTTLSPEPSLAKRKKTSSARSATLEASSCKLELARLSILVRLQDRAKVFKAQNLSGV